MLNTSQLKKVVIALSKFLVYLVDSLLEKHSSKKHSNSNRQKPFEVSVVTMVTLVTFFFCLQLLVSAFSTFLYLFLQMVIRVTHYIYFNEQQTVDDEV